VGHAWGGATAWTVGAMHPRVVSTISVLSAPHPLVTRRAVRRHPHVNSHVLRFQLPIYPERWLTGENALQVAKLLSAWSGPKWRSAPEFDEVIRRCRQAMTVPGVAHSALEYYRWAVRSQVRSDGRRFAEAVDKPMQVPVLQIHGELDPVSLESSARASRAWLGPGSEFRCLPEVGHFPHQEAPHTTSKLLTEFLRKTN
jgi:pimeloyl-ACP methyl ester carboxylesterase